MKLPLNCSVEYHPSFLLLSEATKLQQYFGQLKRLTTTHRIETVIGEVFHQENGKLMFITKELYEANALPESQWGPTMIWSEEMELIRERIIKFTGHHFDVCVCIYYEDGNSGVGYHSDFVAFGNTSIIPSLSLGEERIFQLRENLTNKEHEIVLENGSLLIMGAHCQERYEHGLPLNPEYKNPRFNLTFRKYGFDQL